MQFLDATIRLLSFGKVLPSFSIRMFPPFFIFSHFLSLAFHFRRYSTLASRAQQILQMTDTSARASHAQLSQALCKCITA
jgi:hypothetical protein